MNEQHEPRQMKNDIDTCKHNWQFVDEWDEETPWGGSSYIYYFACSICGEEKEHSGNPCSYFDLE